MRTIRLVFLVALVAMPLIAPIAQAAQTRDPGTYFFDQTFGDLQDEANTARQQGKTGVLVMFEKTDCPWCAQMRSTILNQVPIQNYFRKHFIILQIDVDGTEPLTDFHGRQMEEKDFALQYNRIRATPTFVFFGTHGKVLTKYTGTTRNAKEFMWLGKYVVNGVYKKEYFTNYKRKLEQAQSNSS